MPRIHKGDKGWARHLEVARAALKKRRTRLKGEGLCRDCLKPLDREGARCISCNEKENRLSRRRRALGKHPYQRERLKVFQLLSGSEKPFCKYCGCDVYKALELNHKKGGGTKDRRKYSTTGVFHLINIGERDVKDFEVTCKVCNNAHYAEKKWGLKWKVTFLG